MHKIHILFKIKDGPWGGGNQFLKALRDEFKKTGIYEDDPGKSDLILFNSHQDLREALNLKFKYPEKKFIHRIDGPIFLIRGRDFVIDKIIFYFSNKIADFSIFQSTWSLRKCKELGFKSNFDSEAVIHNAPDNTIFNKKGKKEFNSKEKIRLIATSWSQNWNKGFDVYRYLDNNLDFNKYEFIFIGNSPINFKNAKHIKPLPSKELSEELKKSDIFITASKKDPCSNSLIEALSCGLPAVAYNDGGHPELIQSGGEIFNKKEEIIDKIERIVNNYSVYEKNIPTYQIQDIAQQYADISKKNIQVKKIGFWNYIIMLLDIYITNMISFIK